MNVITAENLSKQYVLGARQPYSFREMLTGMFDRASGPENLLWALRDVSFSVGEGETLGLVGHNGAGKSTLLKILSRITRPTKGTASIRGRVGSLLEVGTGFHSELSGRENIYLNGAILGMKRAEIERKFDEIVAFSEIEKFLDTPVKYYSSGMYMRLAFSVAAHLEPQVLIVDEVLAVGDINFQRKCLGKMQDISEGGKTVIFVSHNLNAVLRLCKRAIWLDQGEIREEGDAHSVVSSYMSSELSVGAEKIWDAAEAPGGDVARLIRVRVLDSAGKAASTFDIRRPITIEIEYDVTSAGKTFTPTFHLFNEENICLFVANDTSTEWGSRAREKGRYTSSVEIPANLLAEGIFFVSVAAFDPATHAQFFDAKETVSFSVFDPIEGDSARGQFGGSMIGLVRPLLEWRTEFEEKR